jgi:predicted enzyme related to lactoylglutathione lyase
VDVETYEVGVPYWVDLGAQDPGAAAAFYGALFGWECPEGPPEMGGYRVCLLRGLPVAGIGPKMSPGPSAWTTYVNVADADETAGQVTAAGGHVLSPPMDVMTFGRMGVFADVTGAVFAVWQPGEHQGAGVVNEPGAFAWPELITTDVDAAAAFYASVFGWGMNASQLGGLVAYGEWQVGGRPIGGVMPKPPTIPAEAPPFWNVYFAVADADAAVSEVLRLGGSVMMPPTDIEPGRFAVVADSQGTSFSVIAVAPAPTS